jgi:uncharacterized protein (TIGR03435 family)
VLNCERAERSSVSARFRLLRGWMFIRDQQLLLWRIFVVLLLLDASNAQTSAHVPRFEVASVKPSSEFPSPSAVGGAGTSDPTRFVRNRATLANLILEAYHIRKYQLVAPAWLDTTRFDIQAIVPKGYSTDVRNRMLQALLAERFHLSFHRDSKIVPGYHLVVARGGIKIKEALPGRRGATADTVEHGGLLPITKDARGVPELPPGVSMLTTRINGQMMTTMRAIESMSFLAVRLSAPLHQPVLDRTGLKGEYEYSLFWAADSLAVGPPDWSNGSAPTTDVGGGPTIFQALQSQLGLRLVRASIPVLILTIDHVDRTPTEN